MNNKKLNENYLIKAVILILMMILFLLVAFASKSYAYGTWQGNATSGMPENKCVHTGLMPQLLPGRNRGFTENADTQFPYTNWTTNINANTVFCADNGTIVRFAKYDEKRYFIDSIGAYNNGYYSYATFYQQMQEALEALAEKQAEEKGGTFNGISAWGEISYVQTGGPNDPDDPSRYAIEKDKALIPLQIYKIKDWKQYVHWAKTDVTKSIINQIFSGLGPWQKSSRNNIDPSTDPEEDLPEWNR